MFNVFRKGIRLGTFTSAIDALNSVGRDDYSIELDDSGRQQYHFPDGTVVRPVPVFTFVVTRDGEFLEFLPTIEKATIYVRETFGHIVAKTTLDADGNIEYVFPDGILITMIENV